ncbi:heat shock protein 27-like [Hetaerina americana]|uniref:heat shock protein 27-like n=1 Tax=Hetaerina americana TaxID=62018 RepID=UPI003A7F2419
MAFFPFKISPMDSVEAMQNCFQRLEQDSHQYMAMGMPTMAQARAQSRRCRQWPHTPSQQAGAPNGQNADGVFHINLDVQEFHPDELSVKMVNDQIIVEGNHEEREFGRVSAARHFVHNYSVPEGIKFEDITSFLSPDGILTLSAPKVPSKSGTKEQIIPIILAGSPANKSAASKPSSSKDNSESKE